MAVPVGLIVNELLSNALKHAFVGRNEGKIEVRLTASEEGRINLTVSDDGVGLPDGFDIDKTGTLRFSQKTSCMEPWRLSVRTAQPLI
jgi:two-component sensor histidine kinase